MPLVLTKIMTMKINKMAGKKKNEGVLLPFFLNQRELRMLMFGGKGGVGKTSCATATALYLAQHYPEDSYLLVSTDPAHSLVDSLAGASCPPNLKVLEFEAQGYLDTFVDENRKKLHDIASRGTFLDEEDINRFLELSLPGMDEVMGFMEMTRWINKKTYQCIIVDTAPTGHTLRLLDMPQMIRKWLEALDTLLAKHRYMKKVFSGTYRKDELDLFLEDMADSIKQTVSVMKDKALFRFIPVMIAEALSVYETQALLKELQRIKIPVTDIIVNRVYPENDCPACIDARNRQIAEIAGIEQKDMFRKFKKWVVPFYSEEVHGEKALSTFWESAKALEETILNVKETRVEMPVCVEGCTAPPTDQISLMIFAGKGGVGKTTLACSTAMRIASDFPEKLILLFSTDPAHSLSDCLNMDVKAHPTKIIYGLSAMQIDAQAEFDDLKNSYEKELKQFLKSMFSNLDLTFDREVMERIMDLSPPGLDEIMALTKVMDLMAEHSYDVVILDSAPTGHLIRLLEMPEIIDQWLKVFFNLFLKYKDVFKLPGISKRLISISRDLKRLRSLLHDKERSCLYAVSILTEMSFNETQDLLAACDRLAVNVPVLFLNQATGNNKCTFCKAVYKRESKIKTSFSRSFDGIDKTLVMRQGDLRGIEHLEALGHALYCNKEIT